MSLKDSPAQLFTGVSKPVPFCKGTHAVWLHPDTSDGMAFFIQFSSVQFSCLVVSNSLWPHELQHARLPCPSPTPWGWTGGLACCSSWGRKESDTTEWLNWTELNKVESRKYGFVLWEVLRLLLNDLQAWNSFQIGIGNFYSLVGK